MSLMIPILQMISFSSNKEEKNAIKAPKYKRKKELKPVTNNSTLMTSTKK